MPRVESPNGPESLHWAGWAPCKSIWLRQMRFANCRPTYIRRRAQLHVQLIGLIKLSNVGAAIDFARSVGWVSDSGDDLEIGCDAFVEPIQCRVKPQGAGAHWFVDDWFAAHPDKRDRFL